MGGRFREPEGVKMGKSDHKDDLEYFYAALLNHPSVISDEKKREELEALYLAKETTVCDYDIKCCWDGANCDELVLEKAYEDIPEHYPDPVSYIRTSAEMRELP